MDELLVVTGFAFVLLERLVCCDQALRLARGRIKAAGDLKWARGSDKKRPRQIGNSIFHFVNYALFTANTAEIHPLDPRALLVSFINVPEATDRPSVGPAVCPLLRRAKPVVRRTGMYRCSEAEQGLN